MRRTLFIGIFLIFCLSATGWAQLNSEGDQQFEGFNLSGYDDDGEKSWDVKGDTADIEGAKIRLTNVDANSYGEQNMNVRAQVGIMNQASGNMRLEDDVILTSDDGSTVMTDSIDWEKDKDLVTTEDEVYIKNDMFKARGTGLEAKPGMKMAQLNKEVTVEVETAKKPKEESQVVTVTSDGPMVIDQLLSKARFEKNVVAMQDNQTLRADVIEIYFGKEMSEIKEIICVGNVEIIQGENKSYADRASYNAVDQKITLSGRPKLVFETAEGENGFTAFGN